MRLVLIAGLLTWVNGDIAEKLRLAALGRASLAGRVDRAQGLLLPPTSDYRASATQVQARTPGPDDEDNLERLCNDPFHSFLCKPVGPRKYRIDGNLRPQAVIPPGVFRGESSNTKETRLAPLESGSSLLPDEIQPDEGYSYPRPEINFVNSASSPQDSKEYLPPTAATSPKESREYLPPDNSYLPPSNENDVASDPPIDVRFGSPTTLPTTINEEPNQEGSALLPEQAQDVSVRVRPSNGVSNHHHYHDEDHSLERLCNDPFHSFLCKPITKPRQRLTGRLRPQAKLPSNFLGAGSFPVPAKARPEKLQSGSDLLPSSLTPEDGYEYPMPSDNNLSVTGYQYPRPTNTLATTAESAAPTITSTSHVFFLSSEPTVPSAGYVYETPRNLFVSPTHTAPARLVVAQTRARNLYYPVAGADTASRVLLRQESGSARAGYDYPKPNNGYEYPIPSAPFPPEDIPSSTAPPTTTEEATTSTSTSTEGGSSSTTAETSSTGSTENQTDSTSERIVVRAELGLDAGVGPGLDAAAGSGIDIRSRTRSETVRESLRNNARAIEYRNYDRDLPPSTQFEILKLKRQLRRLGLV